MARHEDAVLQLLELTLRIKRLRAILMGGSGSVILTDEDRAAIEATLPVLAQEVRRLEAWLNAYSGDRDRRFRAQRDRGFRSIVTAVTA